MDLAELNVLGPFRLNSGGQTLADGVSDKARALLTFLACEGMQPRSSLSALLWPYLPQDAAFDNLRKTIYRLRHGLNKSSPGSAELLIASRQSVQLDPERIVVDVLRFQTLLAACDQHSHAALAACDACLVRLADAVELYQGELVAGLALGDAPRFEEWLLLRRETLHHQMLLALGRLAAAWETRRDFARAHSYCRRALALDPLREETQRQHMRLLAHLGQRNQALQQYESCRRLLRDELGIEPDPATIALYEQILRGDFHSPSVESQQHPAEQPASAIQRRSAKLISPAMWGDVPETGRIYGRETELTQLGYWLRDERCQLVTILGIGGMGKTTLAATLANAIAADFDKVVWRSLLNAPRLDELLHNVLLSMGYPSDGLPLSLDEQLALLLDELRQQRCLLILDNVESILQAEGIGQMRAGYENYTQLLRTLAENRHNSTLLLTSRERLQGMARWEEDLPWVRCLQLEGLDSTAGQAILKARGLRSQVVDSHALVRRYSGHPLALKLVAETIQEMFQGDIGAFLASGVVIFDDIRAVLDQQFERLSALEQEILFWLAVEREPVSLVTLHGNLVPTRSMQEVVQALRALQRRSLVQRSTPGEATDTLGYPAELGTDSRFVSLNVVMEYSAERLIEIACREIEHEQLSWLHKLALMQAQAQEYVRQGQARVILEPIARYLVTRLGQSGIGVKVRRILHTLRTETVPASGYAVGNLLNLLILLEIDVGGLDLAGLPVWQADLRQANLAGSNLAGADLTGSHFADAFSVIRAVAVSPDGTLVAGATTDGEIRLWDAESGRLIDVFRGHKGSVRSIAFRPDGRVLASGSEDRTIRLWRVDGLHAADIEVEPFAHVMEGHAGRVVSVVFYPNGKTLASGSVDGTVRVWDVASGETRKVLYGHESWVWAVAISPDGGLLASSGHDRIIRLWDLQTTELRATLSSHKEVVSSLAFDPTGARLASGSFDYSVCVWDITSGQQLYTLESATDLITCVAFSPDGNLLATGGDDCLIRVWDMRSQEITSVFHGHTDIVCSVAFTPNGQALVSGGADQQLCLWDIHTNRVRRLFSGHSQAINALAFHPSGKMFASGHGDRVVRLWDLDNREIRQTLHGHTHAVNCVAFSPDGTLLASGSDDRSIQVWTSSDVGPARRHTILKGHQRGVTAVCFHPHEKALLSSSEDQAIGFWGVAEEQLRRFVHADNVPIRTIAVDPAGKLLASASDKNIRLWNVQSGSLYTTVRGHANLIFSLVFSGDSHWLASGGSDGSIGLWDVCDPAQPQHTGALHGHSDRVFAAAFHPNGRILASGSADCTVRLWDMQNHEVMLTLVGHTHWVCTVAFSPDGSIIASGGMDETIRLWDSQSGECIGVFHSPGPYAGMNISGAVGISEAERTTLKLLGAIEQ